MTAPWKDATKSPLDQLTDIMIQLPGLLEDLDTVRAFPVERAPKAWNDLLHRCSSLEEALLVWKSTMGDDLRTYDYTLSDDPRPKPQSDRDFALLHLNFLYWSCSILLYTTIHMASGEAGQHTTHTSPIPFSSRGSPNYRNERNPTLHAHRIIHAVPISHEHHAGGYGALGSTFPLGLALRYLVVADTFPHEGGSRCTQKEFLQAALSQPFMGAYSARFIDHLQRVDTPAPCLKDVTGWRGVELRARRWWFGPAEEKKLELIQRNALQA